MAARLHATEPVRVDMARALEVEVVAEGIETQAERDFLDGVQCSMGQGYLFARPMPADQFQAFLQARGTPAPARVVLAGPIDPAPLERPQVA